MLGDRQCWHQRETGSAGSCPADLPTLQTYPQSIEERRFPFAKVGDSGDNADPEKVARASLLAYCKAGAIQLILKLESGTKAITVLANIIFSPVARNEGHVWIPLACRHPSLKKYRWTDRTTC